MNNTKDSTLTEGIRLTPAAAAKIRSILVENKAPDTMYLFVGVKGGGCAGLQFVMDIRDEDTLPPNETDELFKSEGIPIVVDFKSYMVGNLAGTEIDYIESLMGSGFKFTNEHFKHQCGCGKSYSA